MTQLLLGQPVADQIIESVSHTCYQVGVQPGLSVVQVGDDPASSLYVKKKVQRTQSLGWRSEHVHLPSSVKAQELISILQRLNHDPHVHGILVQLPLPSHLNSYDILEHLDPQKDVDGFHPHNMGKLLCGVPILAPPCTPLGVMALLRYYRIPLAGKKVAVMSRSNIVGKPMSLMLVEADASVLWTHKYSKQIPQITREADVVITATGMPNLVDRSYVNASAAVIDIGITKQEGKTVGDVNASQLSGFVKALSPVPGGVGPMTIAMLMRNVASLALQKPLDGFSG